MIKLVEQEYYDVCVILYEDIYSPVEMDYTNVVKDVKDWIKVSVDDYKKLVKASHVQGFKVVTRPQDAQGFIDDALKKYDVMLKEQEKAKVEREKLDRQRQEARAKAALAKRLKLKAKTLEDKKKLLEQLQAELNPINT